MSDKRIRRPAPARTAPRRQWPTAAPARGPAANGTPPPDAAGTPRERIEATVSKSVELGYKVIDDYLQQGQRTAERLSAGSLTAEAVATEAQDLGTRVARYASDFFGAWMELLELAAAGRVARQGAAAPAATEPAQTPPAPTAPTAARPARLQIALETDRSVELRLDVHADRIHGPLRAHALRSADPRRGRLDDVRCSLDGDAPVVHLRVSPAQGPGRYEGLLVDERTNRPAGSIAVTLGKQRPPVQPRASRRPRASSASPSSKPSARRR